MIDPQMAGDIDQAQRHRRKRLAWILLSLAALMLLLLAFSRRVLLDQLLLGTVINSYALLTSIVLIFLALAGSGFYLLHTIRNR